MDEKRYDVFVTKPAKGSRYEYLLMAFALLDAEPVASLWMTSPMVLPKEANDRDARKYARLNQSIELNATRFEQQATARLENIGVAKDRHAEPEVRKLLDDIARGLVAATFTHFGAVSLPEWSVAKSNDGAYPRALCREVIWAALGYLGRPGPVAVARFLNEETCNNERGYGLEPDHVYRALKARAQSLRKTAPRNREKFKLWELATLTKYRILTDRFNALCFIAEQARFRPDLRHLRGAALAVAIHEKYDLYEQMDRVERIRRQSPAAA